ncbi:nodulin MtN21 /EamA-like transporter family protein [Prunus dulcis]|uniref:WAT1-related protein n=1 Tax=Prunus dulcis TaxID=3755 RepID=A0A4Y1RHS2_PRUDU|nr:nodulin MtN21 /EamA-like transporter family protein [Prunus dulcis]
MKKKRPPLTFSVICKFFLLSLAGITVMQNCVFTGVSYSSPTLASALSNLVPAFTFFLAVVFRMEKFDLRNSRSQIKIMGTLVSISGALIVTLYKGPAVGFLPSQPAIDSSPPNPTMLTSMNNWVTGGLFLTTASLSLAIWNTAQAAILKGYPSEMTVVSFYCFFGTIQSAILTLIVEKNPNVWALRLDMELISILYSAIFGSVITFSTLTWCIQKKGPVFVAMFKPLGIAIAALMGAIFLGDTLHVGSTIYWDEDLHKYSLNARGFRTSAHIGGGERAQPTYTPLTVIGALVIVVGFYGVIWAQSKEEKSLDQKRDEKEQGETHEVVDRLQSSSQRTPLLEAYTQHV